MPANDYYLIGSMALSLLFFGFTTLLSRVYTHGSDYYYEYHCKPSAPTGKTTRQDFYKWMLSLWVFTVISGIGCVACIAAYIKSF